LFLQAAGPAPRRPHSPFLQRSIPGALAAAAGIIIIIIIIIIMLPIKP
jgi:hypothetical protein